jgi:hypothetical protein
MRNQNPEQWLELRDDAGRLHARFDLVSGRLETKLHKRTVIFDLTATRSLRRSVLVCESTDPKPAVKFGG